MENENNGLTEVQWFEIANHYARSLNYAISGDFEDYRSYYESGYSAEEAISACVVF